ncbi:efflux transporter, RND family, MFP subunit [Roseobacter sp. SK209-2-6]|uniref:efflux RND transporter periplasmic adaptor subunit n=1 Tax=Roseobacter sp. SK209-2-6 TaxID=388739 RepID=UPI0000F3F32E|nr:efflux RND transporter periplasmic adaptor subunit [Roseobacter sp. SK209-2-6]EBA16349.1 efflux transporter, RND family, MFP subunit [Roseobacter sp. SK209-2-6]
MKLIPLITAILVSLGLYFLVIERETLLAFARGQDPAATTTAANETTAEQDVEAVVAENRVGVVAMHSEARVFDSAVILRGMTEAVRQVNVRAETSAIVISEPQRRGAQVKAGDLLCELDPGTRPASLLETQARLIEARARMPEAEARVEEARARLSEAKINLTAASKLSEGGYASETRLAAAKATERSAVAGVASALGGLETTRAGIESAQAAVAAAEKEIDRLRITAPFDGHLESDTAEIGSLMLPGDLCATVIQLDTMKLVGFVPETQVNRIALDALAGAELATGDRVQGKVTFVSRAADPATRTFEVEISVPNPDLAIRDGQTADIAISADGATAHKLPQSSLTLNNEGQLGVRVVREDQTAGFFPVDLLRDEADGVWVSGLPQKADVIIVGQEFVTSGVAVAPAYREASQ